MFSPLSGGRTHKPVCCHSKVASGVHLFSGRWAPLHLLEMQLTSCEAISACIMKRQLSMVAGEQQR